MSDQEEIQEIGIELLELIAPLLQGKKTAISLLALNRVHATFAGTGLKEDEKALESYIKLVEKTFGNMARSIFKDQNEKEKDNVH